MDGAVVSQCSGCNCGRTLQAAGSGLAWGVGTSVASRMMDTCCLDRCPVPIPSQAFDVPHPHSSQQDGILGPRQMEVVHRPGMYAPSCQQSIGTRKE